MAAPSSETELLSRNRSQHLWAIPFLAILALAPLLGRIGPFLYIPAAFGAIGPRRQTHTGLGTFALLACLYFAYLALPALWFHPFGSVKGSVREAAHMTVPVVIAALLGRWLRPLDTALLYKVTVVGVIVAAAAASVERLATVEPRSELFASNPIYLSAALLYSAVLIATMLQRQPEWWRIAGLAGIVSAATVIGFLAQSRAYLLVLVAVLSVMGVSLLIGSGRRSLQRLFPLVALLAGVALFSYTSSSTIYHRYNALLSIPEQFGLMLGSIDAPASDRWVDSSTRMRVAMIVGGVKAFAEAPVFGHGLADRYMAAVPHMPDDIAVMGNFHHLHNDLLSQAVAGGLVGLAIYLALVFYPAFRAWQTGLLRTWQGQLAVMTSLVSFGIGFGNTLLFADLPAYLFAVNSLGALLLLADAEKPDTA